MGALGIALLANAACITGTPYGVDPASSSADLTGASSKDAKAASAKQRPANAKSLIVTHIDPASVPAGSNGNGLTVTVTGSGFTNGSKVTLGGQSLATTYTSGTKLTANVPGDKLAGAGSLSVSVSGTDDSHSNEVSLIVFSGSTLASLTPTSTEAQDPSSSATVQLNVAGSNFDGSSVVVFNGTDVDTTLNSASALTATVPASLVANPGQVNVSVRGTGSVSQPLTFTIATPASTAGGSCGGGSSCDDLGLMPLECIDTETGPAQCLDDGCLYQGCE
jgi:hypothetical protein